MCIKKKETLKLRKRDMQKNITLDKQYGNEKVKYFSIFAKNRQNDLSFLAVLKI